MEHHRQLLSKTTRAALKPAFLAVAVYLALILSAISVGGTPFVLVGLHQDFVDADHLEVPCTAVSDTYGYDGLAFFRLALDPATDQPQAHGITLDHPAYRHQRIAYPATAWLIGQRHPNRTLVALIGISMLAIAALAFVGARVAVHFGYTAWLGALAALAPGLAISTSRLLAEPMAQALMLGSIYALSLRRFPLAAIMLSAAVLTRETMIVVVLAWAVVAVMKWPRGEGTFRSAWWLLPVGVFLLWQGVLYQVWGGFSSTAQAHVVLPLAGIVRSVGTLISPLSMMNLYFLAMMAFVLAWMVIIGSRIRSLTPAAVSFALLCMLLLCASSAVWSNSPSFLRVCGLLIPLGLFVWMESGMQKRSQNLVAAALAGTWLLTAAAELYRYYLVAPTLWDACPA